MEGRTLQGSSGLRLRDGGNSRQAGPDDGAAHGLSIERLHSGTSDRCSLEEPETDQEVGSGASSQRGERRQSLREPDCGLTFDPQRRTQSSGAGASAPPRYEPETTPRLEVVEALVPPGWLDLFVPVSISPECEEVGTREVRAARNAGGPAGATRNGTMGDFSGKARAFDYADADGLEEVPAYRCAPGGPGAELDRQSGPSQSTEAVNREPSQSIGYGVASWPKRMGRDCEGMASPARSTITG